LLLLDLRYVNGNLFDILLYNFLPNAITILQPSITIWIENLCPLCADQEHLNHKSRDRCGGT
jgi:hypothetical protein